MNLRKQKLLSLSRKYVIPVACLLLHILLVNDSLSQSDLYSVEMVSFCLDEYDEFSPVYYKNGITYCSNRKNNSSIRYHNMHHPLFSIFYIDSIHFNKKGKGDLLAKEITTSYNDGPASFNKVGNIICFARNINIDKVWKDTRDNANRMGIFLAKNIDETWKNIEPFLYNSEEYSNHSPSLSPNGKTLYFSSNMPGGYGGLDIYYSEYSDNKWQKPKNLGPEINTNKDESFPFISNSGKLFFSSEGHGSLGGKDVFYTKNIKGNWTAPVHLGDGINSSFDDFGLITDNDLESGFFSSNRGESNDIYSFRIKKIHFNECTEQKKKHKCFYFQDDLILENDSINPIYEWEFSEGVKLKGKRIKHCFPGKGKYSVLLRVINPATGDTLNIPSPYIFELEDIEQAFINSEAYGNTREAISFDGFQSNLPDITIKDYFWDFGEGFTQQGESVVHSFEYEGEYIVKLGIIGTDDNNTTIKKCVSKKINIQLSEINK